MMNRIGNGEWVSDGMTATTSHLRTITLSLDQPSFQSRETRSTRVERVFRSSFSWYQARQFGLPACAIASGETSGSERSQQPPRRETSRRREKREKLGEKRVGREVVSHFRKLGFCCAPEAGQTKQRVGHERFLRFSHMPRRLGEKDCRLRLTARSV